MHKVNNEKAEASTNVLNFAEENVMVATTGCPRFRSIDSYSVTD